LVHQQRESAFREWFESQRRWQDPRQLAREAGIPYNTLRGYLSGKAPGPANARRLWELTGFDGFPQGRGAEVTAREPQVRRMSLESRIALFRHLVEGLTLVMDSFHNGTRSERERLRAELRDEIARFHVLVRALASERARQMVIEEGGGRHGGNTGV